MNLIVKKLGQARTLVGGLKSRGTELCLRLSGKNEVCEGFYFEGIFPLMKILLYISAFSCSII